MQSKRKFEILFVLLLFFLGDANANQISTNQNEGSVDTTELIAFTKRVLEAVKQRNYIQFSSFIHPKLGLRFSPYAYTDTKSDLIFSAQSFKYAVKRNRVFLWGSEDPTGESIRMTVKNYFRKYVYDVDFLKMNEIAVNRFIGGGNSLNNLKEVYKDCDFVEFYCKGIEEKYGGMDWRSVRLVIKMYQGKLYLVGVIHDEWTI